MDWHILWEYRAALWSGLVVTVWISALGIAGSTVVGVVIGCLGSTPSFYLRKLTSAYTQLLRNLPLLVTVFFFYFVLSMPTIPAALLGLVLHHSAYIADVTGARLRSGAPPHLATAPAL